MNLNLYDRPASRKNILCRCALHYERVCEMPGKPGIDMYTCVLCDRMWTRFNFKRIPVWREVLVSWFWNLVILGTLGLIVFESLK